MKIWELSNGIDVPITEEESKLVDKFFEENTPSLTEREEIVAQMLVRKDILIKNDEFTPTYRLNYMADVWRD